MSIHDLDVSAISILVKTNVFAHSFRVLRGSLMIDETVLKLRSSSAPSSYICVGLNLISTLD